MPNGFNGPRVPKVLGALVVVCVIGQPAAGVAASRGALGTQEASGTATLAVGAQSVLTAIVRARCDRCDWRVAGREAVVLRVTLDGNYSQHLPLVRGDRVQLQQVILNLIVNGLEAIAKSKDGARELIVSSDQNEEDKVIVAVSDSGEGLDAANLEHLFDAFFTTRPDGMGMRLAISRTIIEAHGGRLWATSNSPRGAVFQFTLPANAESAP